eukprot:CAMPEP_0114149884 /NCGR_PEP_ID=MMETSP0043_2-20121206/22406_1 /TAXON_ID=464988 /ORGANISM="Hemiselmis andersenii, Strain CCMP644" /LENGTH=66 /DNA_ID=CAMNT_0001244575 /DNA_START=20 /DNA_END=217 /DNA_ORIENTATION=+
MAEAVGRGVEDGGVPSDVGAGGDEESAQRIANAVQFLVHPKVQGATMEDRRKFLAKKGLTAREVEE